MKAESVTTHTVINKVKKIQKKLSYDLTDDQQLTYCDTFYNLLLHFKISFLYHMLIVKKMWLRYIKKYGFFVSTNMLLLIFYEKQVFMPQELLRLQPSQIIKILSL